MAGMENLRELWKRLSKNEKRLFYITVVFLSLALLDRLVIHSIVERILSLDRSIRESIDSIEKQRRILSSKESIEKEKKIYAPYLEKKRFRDEDVLGILKEVGKLAERYSVSVQDIKPIGVEESGVFKKYRVSLICESQMDQLAQFLYAIENSPSFLRVEKMEISPKSQGLSVAYCKIIIAKLVIP